MFYNILSDLYCRGKELDSEIDEIYQAVLESFSAVFNIHNRGSNTRGRHSFYYFGHGKQDTGRCADGYDPEVGASTADTNGYVYGLDNGRYPSPTVYSFGLNISF